MKTPENQGSRKQLVLWITHARREFWIALERLFQRLHKPRAQLSQLWSLKVLVPQNIFLCLFFGSKNGG